jgi:hypothetical protein
MIDVRSVNNAAFSYTDLLEYVDFFRLDARRKQDRERQVALGQFFTPAPVARLMASMVECPSRRLMFSMQEQASVRFNGKRYLGPYKEDG